MTAEQKYKVRDELFNCLHDHKRGLDKADRYADYGMGFSEAMKIVAMYIFDDDNPLTNGDKIRSMTDENLAVFLGFAAQDAFCYGRGMRDKMLVYPFGSHESTLDWLKQEADNDDR